MPQAATQTQATSLRPTSMDMPLAGRASEVRNFVRAADAASGTPLATAEIIFSAGAAVQRYDYYRDRPYLEELVVEEGAIRLARMQRGAPLLDSHSSWRLSDNLGVVENPAIANGLATCTATFSRRDEVKGIVQDVADGILRNISVGYIRHRIEMVPPVSEGGLWRYRVTDWEPMECSVVLIPADMDAQIQRSAPGATAQFDSDHADTRTFPCEFIEIRAAAEPAAAQVHTSAQPQTPTVGAIAETPVTRKETPMPQLNGTTAGSTTAPAIPDNAAPEQRSAAPAATAPATADASVHAARAADILSLCARHGMTDLAEAHIRQNSTVDQVRSAILDKLASNDAATGGQRNVSIQTVRDEMQTRMAGIEQAITHRIAANTKLDDNGRQYRGMSLIELGRDFLNAHHVDTRGMSRLELSGKILHFRATGMHGTSDFPSLFANVANKRLRNAYAENPGTYDLWARRAPNAPDFKEIAVTQLGNAPALLQTNEHGEFKYGSMSDGKETYAVITYGRIVSLTRQAIMNDDLRAFDRLVTAFGSSARRLENGLVYSQLTANAALNDGVALFHATHANLGTGGGSALSVTALTAGRTAMRVQTGLAGEPLNLAPSYLIVPAALEQAAYQLTSSNFVPAKTTDINEFRAGGRTSVEPVVEPLLDASSATAWYLAASNGQVDTVEYCYLDGAEGPIIETEVGFETDGISYKCREDFAAKAIDHRGLYKSNGA